MKEILYFKVPGRIQPLELILISEWIRPENSAGYTKRTDFLVFSPHTPILDVLNIKQDRQTVMFTYSRDIAKFIETTFIKSFFVRYISLPDTFWIFISFHIPLDTVLIFLSWQHSLSLYLVLKCVEWFERSQRKNSNSRDCLCLTENTPHCAFRHIELVRPPYGNVRSELGSPKSWMAMITQH